MEADLKQSAQSGKAEVGSSQGTEEQPQENKVVEDGGKRGKKKAQPQKSPDAKPRASLSEDGAEEEFTDGEDQAQLQDQTKDDLYKTELCRKWQQVGSCRYGDKCQFAHGVHELRNVLRHPLYKTSLCKSFQATGTCRYGSRCRFIHDESEQYLSTLPRGVATLNLQEKDNNFPRVPSAPANLSSYTSTNNNPQLMQAGQGSPTRRYGANPGGLGGIPPQTPLRMNGSMVNLQQHGGQSGTPPPGTGPSGQNPHLGPIRASIGSRGTSASAVNLSSLGQVHHHHHHHHHQHHQHPHHALHPHHQQHHLQHHHLPPHPPTSSSSGLGFPATYQDFLDSRESLLLSSRQQQQQQPPKSEGITRSTSGLFAGYPSHEMDVRQIPVAPGSGSSASGFVGSKLHGSSDPPSPLSPPLSSVSRTVPSESDADLKASASSVALSTLESPDGLHPSSPSQLYGESHGNSMSRLELPPSNSYSDLGGINRSASQPVFHSQFPSQLGHLHGNENGMYGHLLHNDHHYNLGHLSSSSQHLPNNNHHRHQQAQQQQQHHHHAPSSTDAYHQMYNQSGLFSIGGDDLTDGDDPIRKVASLNELSSPSSGSFMYSQHHQGDNGGFGLFSSSGFEANGSELDLSSLNISSQGEEEEPSGLFY